MVFSSLLSLLGSIRGNKATQFTFTNPNADIIRDVIRVLATAVIVAVVTRVVQRHFFWPLARWAVRSVPKDVKRQSKKPVSADAMSSLNSQLLEDEDSSNDGAIRRRAHLAEADGVESFRASDSVRKHHENERLLQATRLKFVVAATKMTSYVVLLTIAYFGLCNEDWMLKPNEMHLEFQDSVPVGVRIFYLAESSYYIYNMVAIFYEPKMKDRVQMMVHHVFTVFLLLSSYYWNAVKYGSAIAVLHDISDPLMEAAKLFNYAQATVMSHVFFILFALSFFFLRVFIFPTQIIRATYENLSCYPHYYLTFTSLTGLWVLHVIWSYMICRVFYRNMVLGINEGDVRETDD